MLSEEHLKILSSFGTHSGTGYVQNSKLHWKRLASLASRMFRETREIEQCAVYPSNSNLRIFLRKMDYTNLYARTWLEYKCNGRTYSLLSLEDSLTRQIHSRCIFSQCGEMLSAWNAAVFRKGKFVTSNFCYSFSHFIIRRNTACSTVYETFSAETYNSLTM